MESNHLWSPVTAESGYRANGPLFVPSRARLAAGRSRGASHGALRGALGLIDKVGTSGGNCTPMPFYGRCGLNAVCLLFHHRGKMSIRTVRWCRVGIRANLR